MDGLTNLYGKYRGIPCSRYLAWCRLEIHCVRSANGIIIGFSGLMAKNYRDWKKKLKINDKSNGWHIFQIVRTFILVNISLPLTGQIQFHRHLQ